MTAGTGSAPGRQGPDPYPLILRPILFEKIWGGERLRGLGKAVAAGKRIGESWEVADMASTAASGGGGAAAHSIIEQGPLAGRTLHDALVLWGRDLLGQASAGADGRFPLLVKLLDASENLSVQVHPSAAFARENPWAHIKTECWYVLAAEPGSLIYKGLRPGVPAADFARAARAGLGETVVPMLRAVPAVPGESHVLPSGTVHALGAGVLVAEVQTPSDTTFRLYDWGRVGRALHVEEALRCIDFSPAPAAARLDGGRAARTSSFEVVLLSGQVPQGRCVILIAPQTAIRVETDAGEVTLTPGATALIPAACEARIAGGTVLAAVI